MTDHIRSVRFQIWLAVMLATLLLLPSHAIAASARSKFYSAEGCYQHLKKDPAHKKYRDRWFPCINRFKGVHKHNPRGPWAAAGLFRAGQLYAELYSHSYYRGDKKEALDLFDRVIRGYPQSRYVPRAKTARANLRSGKSPKTVSVAATAARTRYKRAQAKYAALQKSARKQKRRDLWLDCINAYQSAYKADSDGPLAAASLFGAAQAYLGLHAHSFRGSDKSKAHALFQKLIDAFPDSPYAEKASIAMGTVPRPTAKHSRGDDISKVIVENLPAHKTNGDTGPIASSQSPAIIQGLRFWSNPRYTRVVIDADRDTVFTYRELREDPKIGKPQRIYIDVHKSRLGKNIQKVVPINDNLLSDARAGQYRDDTVRVVVDIKSFQTFKIFSLKNPFRVVLDVWGTTAKGQASRMAQSSIAADQKGEKLPPSAIVKQLALGVRRIVIDPGHGGRDYGAPGYLKGVHEKHVVLQIARHLQKMIKAQLHCEAILTRSTDRYLSLEERTAIANTKNADLFISIHTNASSDRRAYGIETYILNLATDDEAIRVAAMENATSAKNISDLDSILQDLMKNAKVSESTRLASYVQQAMSRSLKRKYKHVRNKGIKQAPFYVLLGADMPSILIETSFISNPRECKRLKNPNYQKQLCKGIVEGIKRYIKETNPVALQYRRTDEKGNG